MKPKQPRTLADAIAWANGDPSSECAGWRNDNSSPEAVKGWHESTMAASRWARREMVHWEDAAMLLAGFEPSTAGPDWYRGATDGAGPKELHALHAWCLSKRQLMTLFDWAAAASREGQFVHRWLRDYMAASMKLTANQRRGMGYYVALHRAGHVFSDPRRLRGLSDAIRAAGIEASPQDVSKCLKDYLTATKPEARPL